MATPFAERPQPVRLAGSETPSPELPSAHPRKSRFGLVAMSVASVFAVLWVAGAAAYVWGYFGLVRLAALDIQGTSLLAVATFVPAFLFLATAWALARGHAMELASEALVDATDRLFSADDPAARTAVRLGRAVRKELDAFNVGLDGAFSRMRALESALENQIGSLDEASARAEVRGESVAARLSKERERIDIATGSLSDAAARAGDAVAARLVQERERIEAVAESLTGAAERASETVAGRTAQLKASMQTAETSLKAAGQTLDAQAAAFRTAASSAAEAPRLAAVELDRHAKAIESVSEATMARAEFILGRHERQRTVMNDLLIKLKEESANFESAVGRESAAITRATELLNGEARKFETVTGKIEEHLERLIANTSAQANQLTQNLLRETESLKESGEAAATTLSRMADTVREASTERAYADRRNHESREERRALPGRRSHGGMRAVARASGELSAKAVETRAAIATVADETQRHLLALPGIAQQEAQRIRQMVRNETEEMLDISARTLSTIRTRTGVKAAPDASLVEPTREEREREGMFGLARKLTGRQKPKTNAVNDDGASGK